MNRATLPPTFASRLQARFTRNTQMQPSFRYCFARFAVLVVPNEFAGVVDDARVPGDAFRGEHAEPVNERSLTHDLRQLVWNAI